MLYVELCEEMRAITIILTSPETILSLSLHRLYDILLSSKMYNNFQPISHLVGAYQSSVC